MTVKVGGCHPKVVAGDCSAMHQQWSMSCQPPHHCHPIVCNRPQKVNVILCLQSTPKIDCHPMFANDPQIDCHPMFAIDAQN